MLLYIRENDEQQKDLIEIEFFEKDDTIEFKQPILHHTNCFNHLLERFDDEDYIIDFMNKIKLWSDLREWYYDIYCVTFPFHTYDHLIEFISGMLNKQNETLNLCIVED